MENIKVRALDAIEPKGTAEVEQELLDKHQQEIEGVSSENVDIKNNSIENTNNNTTEGEDDLLTEEKVLSFIGKKYNKEIKSFDDLMAEKNESIDLPEDVSAFLKYKNETGRGISDFIKLNKDIDSMDSESILKDYLIATEEGLDEEDIETLLEDYRYDEDIDEESKIKKIKIETKKAVAEARKYFNSQKEKYKIPLESREPLISEQEKESYESYKQYTKQAKTIQEENERKRQWFNQKSEEVFSEGFKGFEFELEGKKVSFNPGDRNELKKLQSTPDNFIRKFLDEQGLIKDAQGYHKSLAVAMNPDRFAKFFYEQGKSDAVDGTMRNIKNIQMSSQNIPLVKKPTNGIQVKEVNPDSGRSLKIRSIKKV